MHGGASVLTASVNGTLVRVQTGKRGEQRRVDVEQSPCVLRHKARRQYPHETGQHHQGGSPRLVVAANGGGKRLVKVRTAGVGAMAQHLGGNTLFARQAQAPGVWLVANDGHHLGAKLRGPGLFLRGAHDGCHIGAATRDKNDDGQGLGLNLHTGGIIASALPCNKTHATARNVARRTNKKERSC